MRLVVVTALALVMSVDAGGAEGQIKTGCFVGPTFIQGIPRDACLQADDWGRVMEASIVDGSGHPIVLLERGWRSAPDDQRVASRSRRCNEYLGTHRGSHLDTPEQRAIDDTFRRACLTANAIFDHGAGAGALVRSYMARDGSDVTDLLNLPSAVLELAFTDDLQTGGPTLTGEVQSGRLKVLDPRIDQFKIAWRGHVFTLIATGRADVNGDRLEDLIVMVMSQFAGGGERSIRFAFVTREVRGGVMSVVKPVLSPCRFQSAVDC